MSDNVSALPVCAEDGQFLIMGQSAAWVDLRTPAWSMLTYRPLEEYGDRAGENRRLPRGVSRPLRHRPTDRFLSEPFDVIGSYDRNGVEQANEMAGWSRNYRYLHDELVIDPGTREGTREARFIDADGNVRTGEVQVLAIPVGEHERSVARCTFDFIIVGGFLT